MSAVSSSLSLSRILQEGYGPGAWHGADIKAAIDGVAAADAFRRPGAGRHNVAEIVLHHAYYVHSVRGRLTTVAPEPFALSGDDWFELDGQSSLDWEQVREVLDTQYGKLAALVADIDSGRIKAAKDEASVLELVLGITCHSAYHAGQIQLIKALA